MLTGRERERMRADAELALARAYGYPEARVQCAHHVRALLAEVARLDAVLAFVRGDARPLRDLAGG